MYADNVFEKIRSCNWVIQPFNFLIYLRRLIFKTEFYFVLVHLGPRVEKITISYISFMNLLIFL